MILQAAPIRAIAVTYEADYPLVEESNVPHRNLSMCTATVFLCGIR